MQHLEILNFVKVNLLHVKTFMQLQEVKDQYMKVYIIENPLKIL